MSYSLAPNQSAGLARPMPAALQRQLGEQASRALCAAEAVMHTQTVLSDLYAYTTWRQIMTLLATGQLSHAAAVTGALTPEVEQDLEAQLRRYIGDMQAAYGVGAAQLIQDLERVINQSPSQPSLFAWLIGR